MAGNKEATLLLKIKSAGEDVIDRVAESFSRLKEIGMGVLSGLSALAVKSIHDYREQELATNELTRAMINQGVYSKTLKDDYLNQAAALQKLTTFGDEQIIAAQATLQGYLGNITVSRELTQATLDLAAAKKMDLASAADLVGKSIGTDTNALRRNGIEVNANATEQEKLAQVIKGIETRWHGQAEAAAQGLGVIQQLKNVMSDIYETIGERLSPVVVLLANKMKHLGEDTAATKDTLDGVIGTFHIVANAGVIISALFEAMGASLGIFAAAFMEFGNALDREDWTGGFSILADGVKEAAAAAVDAKETAVTRMAEIDKAFLASAQATHQQEAEMQAESDNNKAAASQLAADTEAGKRMERQLQQDEIDITMASATAENLATMQLQAEIKKQQNLLAVTTDAHAKLEIQNRIHNLNLQLQEAEHAKLMVQYRRDTFSTIATLQNSHNSALAIAGKAAAITQIAIDTPVAISKALAAFPPPFNFVAAGLVGVAMAVQAANIAGVQLAEGGVVMPRAGGVQATIAEAGQPEAVIPLDRFSEFGVGGGGLTVIIQSYGGMLGSESEAHQFAVAVDREIYKLRQNNESVAFDSGVV